MLNYSYNIPFCSTILFLFTNIGADSSELGRVFSFTEFFIRLQDFMIFKIFFSFKGDVEAFVKALQNNKKSPTGDEDKKKDDDDDGMALD